MEFVMIALPWIAYLALSFPDCVYNIPGTQRLTGMLPNLNTLFHAVTFFRAYLRAIEHCYCKQQFCPFQVKHDNFPLGNRNCKIVAWRGVAWRGAFSRTWQVLKSKYYPPHTYKEHEDLIYSKISKLQYPCLNLLNGTRHSDQFSVENRDLVTHGHWQAWIGMIHYRRALPFKLFKDCKLARWLHGKFEY